MKKFDTYIEQETRHTRDLVIEINKRLRKMGVEQLLRVLWYIDRRLE